MVLAEGAAAHFQDAKRQGFDLLKLVQTKIFDDQE